MKRSLFLLSLQIMSSLAIFATCTGTYNLNWTSLQSTSSLSGSSLTGQTICIQNGLWVNSDFTFYNCTLYVASNTDIGIYGANKLTLDGTRILSCDGTNMWNGISLSTSSPNLTTHPITLEVKNGSVIEDAKIAIYVTRDNGVKVSDSYLNNKEQ